VKIIIDIDESYCVKFYSYMKFIMLLIPMKISCKYKKVKQAKHYTKIIKDDVYNYFNPKTGGIK